MPIRSVSSSSNSDIRRLKALRDRRDVRQAERLFVIEGPRFVEDAMRTLAPRQLVLSESAIEHWQADIDTGVEVIVVPDQLFADVSSTQTPQGVLGVFDMPSIAPIRPAPMLTVVADGIQDPGNLGTMIRSAAANGASQFLYTAGTVDPYNSKVVRAAAGAHFLVPVCMSDDLAADLDGSTVYVAESGAGEAIDNVDWTKPSSVVIGSEAQGSGTIGRRLHATAVTIPMVNAVESLNAAMAASIILYEAFRQRRHREREEIASRI